MLVVGGVVAVGSVLVIALGAMFAKMYRKVDQGRALIINGLRGEPKVTFTGGLIIPVITRAEVMDISVKTIEIDRRGKEGLICRDNIRADIKVNFFVRVNKTVNDVLKVAQAIGCSRASDQATIEDLFNAKFSEALKTVGKRLDFEDLYNKREEFRDQIVNVIGQDLNGFVLEDAAIDFLEQTPLEHLDPHNILDAQGIRKITEMTAVQNVHTNQLRQKERMEMGRQDLTADEAVFQFEQQRADAEARKNKEIDIAQAREQNAAQRVKDAEMKETMVLRKKHEEEIAVAEEAKLRAAEVAVKNREREIGVETERVEKARVLEAISRERETELGRIEKDRELEVKKREIAEVVRGRVAVDKTVAEEEERIKDLRVVAEAKRVKDATVIHAEAQAEESYVTQIKAAEAAEVAAKHTARQTLVNAEAALEAADKQARAKMRMAEGEQAAVAAQGLAEVRVREANAAAIEKEGVAQAHVIRQRLEAEAAGEEQKGLSAARVKEAAAAALEKEGLASVHVREADAVAVEKLGLAEAQAIEKKLVAEAAGLAEKATAMKALDGVGREHEEFRLRLDKEREVELAQIAVRQHVAQAQAEVLAQAMAQAKINIVGGDGEFFDRFVKAVTLGQSADAFVDGSSSVKTLLKDYLDGDKSLVADVKDVLSAPRVGSEDLKNLGVTALLARLAQGGDTEKAAKLKQLLAEARKLGLD
ncbi:MAG: hypothetical protein H6726_02700 [Sandaracinaceae bacterium]|nr:hypothetical protein [Myxococcales bacterium]MCB9656533.1 hypothetical protein [Sandaracinaceae bacterium]